MNNWIIVPNWNGAAFIRECLVSLEKQTQPANILVVDNGSVDSSVHIIESEFPKIQLLKLPKNRGFSGGVNVGISYAMEKGAEMVALFNNDAVAEKEWLAELVSFLKQHHEAGIVTGKLLKADKLHIDSTGSGYTSWGLSFPRGRDEADNGQYDKDNWVFGATGGASLYRISMLEQIGLFDEDFFAYYEDDDLSFRAQLHGWKVGYVPSARAFHQIGGTSSKIKGFTTYHSIKNIPWLFWKNVPWRFVPAIWPRAVLAHWTFMLYGIKRGHFWPVVKGFIVSMALCPKKFLERHQIQKNRNVSNAYIREMLVWGLPPAMASRKAKFFGDSRKP